MFLSGLYDQDIEYLKWDATLQTTHRKLPRGAAKKLKEIMLDNDIGPENFTREFNKIIASTETLRWKSFLYINDLKNKVLNQASQISWWQILLVVGVLSLGFFVYKTYFSKYPKRKKKLKFVYKRVINIIERLFAFVAYYPIIVGVYRSYIYTLLPKYPIFFVIFPDFIKWGIKLYTQQSVLLSYIYIFVIAVFILRRRIPRSRFVRFHIARGLVFFVFQGIPDQIFDIIYTSGSLTNEQAITTALVLFSVYASWILPCLWQALTYRYPKNEFIRDTVEVMLGRDPNQRTWWNRDY